MTPLPEPRGYFLALSAITDPKGFDQYRSVIARLREVYEGRYLVEAQPVTAIVGPPVVGRLSLVEHETFPSLQRMLEDPEHVALVDKLRALAPGPTWAAPGFVPPPARLAPSGEARAYAVSRFELYDPERLERYRALIERLVFSHGGRFLVRIQRAGNLSGPSDGWYLTLAEFGSMAHLQSAADSPDFHDMVKMDLGHGRRTLWIVGGTAPGARQ